MLRDLIPDPSKTVDMDHGQLVVIAARWVLVVAGLLLALWDPAGIGVLRVQIVLILGLAVANFFLQAQFLKNRPVLRDVLYGASVADIAVISLIVVAQGGFSSHVYVFYFPALLAISVAFSPAIVSRFAACSAAAYGAISMATLDPGDEVTLAARMIMMAGVAMCGVAFQNVQRDRRTAIDGVQVETIDDVVDEPSVASLPREAIPFQTAKGA